MGRKFGNKNLHIGEKFGKLTVTKEDRCVKNHSYLECLCECGSIRIVELSQLISGTATSCKKCKIRKDISGKNNCNFIDLSGKKFSRLLVLNINTNPLKQRKFNIMWNCKCDCGKDAVVSTANLKGGIVRSCACIRTQSKLIDLVGQKFGTLMVIKRVYGIKTKTGKIENAWECKCDCGNVINLTQDLVIKNRFGCRKCYGNKFRGPIHPNWRHDISEKERIYNANRRFLPEIRRWRKSIYERDKYICQITGKTGKICAHHLESWKYNKELRFDISNGITILQSAHKLFHHLYGMKCTKMQFEEFKNNLTREQIKLLQ